MSPPQQVSDCPLTLPHTGAINLIQYTKKPHTMWQICFHFNFHCCLRLNSQPQMTPVDQSAAPPTRDLYAPNHHPRMEPLPAWIMEESAALSEAEMLEVQMLKAGILASLQDSPDDSDAKVEVPKSSVSSLRLVIILCHHVVFPVNLCCSSFSVTPNRPHYILKCGFISVILSNHSQVSKRNMFSFRLQQLEKMGFSTEKAVVALAASKQLDGAISLLIDDSIGEQAVVVSKGKSPRSPQST